MDVVYDSPVSHCNLCPDEDFGKLENWDLLTHIRLYHPDYYPYFWPDGLPVIFDEETV